MKLIVVAAIWGGTFVAGHVLTAQASAMTGSFLRYVAANVAFAVVAVRQPLPRLTARQWALCTMLGATGIFAYNYFFLQGLRLIPASRASLIVAMNPTVVAVASAVFYRERLSGAKMAGILCGLTGAAIVISRGDLASLTQGAVGLGEVFLFGCMLSWVAYTLIGRTVLKEVSPFAASAYASVTGGLLLGAGALAEGGLAHLPHLDWQAWVAIVYLGSLGTVLAFTWFYEGVKQLGPAKAAVFLNLVPCFGVTFAVLLLGETIKWPSLVGGGLVIAGVTMMNRAK